MTGVEVLYFVSLNDNLLSVLRELSQTSLLLVFLGPFFFLSFPLSFIHSFFLSQSDLFCIIIAGVECYGCTWSHWYTHARQRPLPYNTQQTDIHVPDGIRTHNPSRRAAADPRLRPRGYGERLVWCFYSIKEALWKRLIMNTGIYSENLSLFN